MLWLKVMLGGCVVLAMKAEDQDKERQWLTWGDILGGGPPSQEEPASYPAESPSKNLISDSTNKDLLYDDYEYAYDYDYAPDSFGESFFDNPDYIYIDTEDENYVPPEVQETDEVPEEAERRTLDFFYHLMNDQFRNGESSKDSADTPRRPSLIEAVFETIDNHIVEDLREWSTYTAQRDAQLANSEPASNVGSPIAIQPVSPDSDIVLVTDEQGHQHVVTVNDIVTSLSHLDERTLTNLLLSPETPNDDRSSTININPTTNFVTAETQNVPVVLGTQKVSQIGGLRPARHTGPTNPTQEVEEEEEVYVIQDENGQVQLVTLDNIISSLALLDEKSLTSLLLEDAVIPAAVSPTSLNRVPPSATKEFVIPVTTTTPKPPVSQLIAIPAAVQPKTTTSIEPEAEKKLSPSVSTDFNGNLKVLAHPGSVKVDLKDLSWTANNEEGEEVEKPEEKVPEKPAPLFIGGSLVETDESGNIHITPDPDKPFTLDIQNIISLAEQANYPGIPSNIQSPKEESPLSEEVEDEVEEQPERGHEILSYLAGVENFLPAAILPRPIQPTLQNAEATRQYFQDPAGVSAFRSSLLQAVNQQRVVPEPTTPQLEVQPLIQRLVQPVVQPIVQAVSQPSLLYSSGGIGASLSRLISNLVGQSAPQQVETVVQVEDQTPEQEFVKIVVRKQAPNSADEHFGDVTIPLPQGIHFRSAPRPAQAVDIVPAQISSRVDVPSPLRGLSPVVQRSLQLQARNVPKFIPPGARALNAATKTNNIASSRSDSGPVLRVDSNAAYMRNLRAAVTQAVKAVPRPLSVVKAQIDRQALRQPLPIARQTVRKPLPITRQAVRKPLPVAKQPIRKPLPTVIPPVTKKPAPSLNTVLQALPPSVLESLKRQAQNARVFSSQKEEEETESTETAEEPESPSAVGPLDRSSYATLPEYPSGGGGYGYDDGHKKSDNPWFDIYLLADLTKVHKVGDTNFSVKSPIIGDPAYFVKTRHHGYGY